MITANQFKAHGVFNRYLEKVVLLQSDVGGKNKRSSIKSCKSYATGKKKVLIEVSF